MKTLCATLFLAACLLMAACGPTSHNPDAARTSTANPDTMPDDGTTTIESDTIRDSSGNLIAPGTTGVAK